MARRDRSPESWSVPEFLCGSEIISEPAAEDQVLINLGAEVPEFFSRFERLCEPLDQDPAVLGAGRARWKYYQDCGNDLKHHQIQRLNAD